MSYWNKSLYRATLATRTANLLTDLTNEKEKLTAANTAFGELAYQSISNSPSVSVIENIALKYRAVVYGFMTAADYDMADCRKLLGYIGAETEDLIFGELHGQWEVAKEKRDKKQAELEKYKRDSTYSVSTTVYICGIPTTVTVDFHPNEYIVLLYKLMIASYQREMDAYQKKLDRLGEFEDKSGALFANSVDFRANATKALSDLKECVSSDGTFKDINYSYALNQLEKLHEQKQNEYLQQWLDKNGDPDWDAIDAFLFQDPDSVTMDQYLAFCKLMDQMSDEQLTELMNHMTKEVYDLENGSYIEVSKVFQNAADLNATIWSYKYAATGFNPEGFDVDAMERAIAVKYGTDMITELATTKCWTSYIDSEEVYMVLPVFVDGSNVYILPFINRNDAVNADYYYNQTTDPENGVKMIYRSILEGTTDDYIFNVPEWTVIKVDDDTSALKVLCDNIDYFIDELGGKAEDWHPGWAFGKELGTYALDFILDKVSLGAVSDARDWIQFVIDLEKEYREVLANGDAHADVKSLEIFKAFYIDRVTSVTTQGRDFDSTQFENLRFNSGELQIAIAAYNKYNDGVDIDINWVYNFKNCTPEQKQALAKYLDWYYTGQNVTTDGLVADYRGKVETTYYSILSELRIDISKAPNVAKLTPAQFKEVQKRIENPNCEIDESLFK